MEYRQRCSSSGVTVVLRKPSAADQTPSIDDLAMWAEIAFQAFPFPKAWQTVSEVICVTPNYPGSPGQFQSPLFWSGFTDVSQPKSVIWLNGQVANYKLLLHELGHAVQRVVQENVAESFKNGFYNPDDKMFTVERAFWRKMVGG